MRTISTFFSKTATIKRKQAGTGAEAGIDVYQSVGLSNGILRPVSNEAELYDKSNYGYEYRWYCNIDDNIRESDILVIDGVNYLVQGIQFYVDPENYEENHKKVILIRTNQVV